MKRREAIGALAAAAASAAFRLTPEEIQRAARAVAAAQQPYQTQFFTPHEWQTVRVLADLIIPRDERSGSATEAGVPEFMDFTMNDRQDAQVEMRGGLAWLDAHSRERFGKSFVEAADTQRTAMLDDIAWPKKAKPELSQGVAFFNFFRDLTASGFYSSKIGIADLDYRGNTFVREWNGCPPEALQKLGVHYED
jgi:gluconate 2-dehydrogenase gamma chain